MDGEDASRAVLAGALMYEQESQLAVRGGEVLAPRLVRVSVGGAQSMEGAFDPGRSVPGSGWYGYVGWLGRAAPGGRPRCA